MSLTILLEIGHNASLKTKITPEGFTHDWEVFVKGQNNSDIQYYVDKVVFNLHETFPKPKRVVKEPPYSIRTSGWAGFKLPIEIYLKNNLEPKKIKFNYDLHLQPSGPPIHIVQKEKYTFFNPSEEFRSKLLKGGAVEGSGKEEHVNRVSSEDKNQMTSKPKLSGSDFTKKHKMKFDEPRTTDFENLFGTPIKKNSKIPEQPKPREPPPLSKSSVTDKFSDKDKNDKSKSIKSIHKDKDKEKSKDKYSDSADKKIKEERKKSKDEKNKDRSKEKSSKKDKEKSPQIRPRSPTPKRSPKRDCSSPIIPKHASTKEKEFIKDEKKEKDRDKEKKEDKKSKKDKREHKEGKHKDREKEREHKEYKSREKDSKSRDNSNKLKESSPLTIVSNSSQNSHKTDKKPKDKEHFKELPKEEEKIERIEKEKLEKEKIRPESEEKEKDKDRQNKHKHKKKDRKEKKEEKHSKKDEKKIEKQSNLNSNTIKEIPKEPVIAPPVRELDKSNLFGSPKSDSPLTPKEPEVKTEINTAFSRDDESSNDSVKISSREASPAPIRVPSKSPSPFPPQEVNKRPELEKKKESPKKKDKKEKKKDKKIDKDHEKRKKRKSDLTSTVDAQPPEKVSKVEDENNSDEESKVSSTEDTTAIIQPKSECDMNMLRDLQHKIMSLKDSADLQRVVQLIAETGQYEVSAHTFDFDLCLLDRSTVRQLQDFFSIS